MSSVWIDEDLEEQIVLPVYIPKVHVPRHMKSRKTPIVNNLEDIEKSSESNEPSTKRILSAIATFVFEIAAIFIIIWFAAHGTF